MSIWSCDWGKLKKQRPGKNPEDGEAAASNQELVFEGDAENIIVTGGLDDVVKVWNFDDDNELSLKHTLTGHSLGIVSVAISSDGQSE